MYKKLIIVSLILVIGLLAVPIKISASGGYTIIVNLSEEEYKALTTEVIDVDEYCSNLVHNRARKAIDKVVLEYSDYQPEKLSSYDKYSIVRNANVKTAVERQSENNNLELGN